VFGPKDGGQDGGAAAEAVLESNAGDTAAALRACISFLLENSDFMLFPPRLDFLETLDRVYGGGPREIPIGSSGW
jgi:hypothetical protein